MIEMTLLNEVAQVGDIIGRWPTAQVPLLPRIQKKKKINKWYATAPPAAVMYTYYGEAVLLFFLIEITGFLARVGLWPTVPQSLLHGTVTSNLICHAFGDSHDHRIWCIWQVRF